MFVWPIQNLVCCLCFLSKFFLFLKFINVAKLVKLYFNPTQLPKLSPCKDNSVLFWMNYFDVFSDLQTK
jgi:hypothetical protein